MPRDLQEARERMYERVRRSGGEAGWARRATRDAAEQVQRGIDTGKVIPPGDDRRKGG